MRNSIYFNHRHTNYNPEKPYLIGEYDDVALMSERAKSTIHLVQNELIGDRTIDDSVLFEALEVVRDELMDIEALLTHFVHSQKSPN